MTRTQRKSPRAKEDEHASLLFAVPLALVYHFGLLLTDVRNGADTLTSALLFVVDRSVLGYVALLVALAGSLYMLARRLEARGSFLPATSRGSCSRPPFWVSACGWLWASSPRKSSPCRSPSAMIAIRRSR